MIRWQETQVSEDQTHHRLEGKSLYSKRFQQVLKFHTPGLAPVSDDTGSYHIDLKGEAAYPARFQRTFGFYGNRAAVDGGKEGWFHILPEGILLYEERYLWCGNFQEGRCPVRNREKEYFHLDEEGKPAYPDRWRYAGDFRDQIAVVQNREGLHTHIDLQGKPIHNEWFSDLDVYHKSIARAQEEKGWVHIDLAGKPLYSRRFAMIEPFYNGQARVETLEGGLIVIDETGEMIHSLKEPEIPFGQASSDIIGFWKSYILYAAVKLNVFEHFPASPEELSEKITLPLSSCLRLLRAMEELGFVIRERSSNCYHLTEKGKLFTRQHKWSLANAAVTWVENHVEPWKVLVESLQQEESVFLKKEGVSWFDRFDEESLSFFQSSLASYAKHDYQKIHQVIDGKRHQKIIDAGGGEGVLLKNMLEFYPHLEGILLERADVLEQILPPLHLSSRWNQLPFDLFQPWPIKGDAIVLSRILHDWNDEKALEILQRGAEALLEGGRIYIIELLLEDNTPLGGQLDLNMLVTTEGKERSLEGFQELFGLSDLTLSGRKNLSQVCQVLEVEK